MKPMKRHKKKKHNEHPNDSEGTADPQLAVAMELPESAFGFVSDTPLPYSLLVLPLKSPEARMWMRDTCMIILYHADIMRDTKRS